MPFHLVRIAGDPVTAQPSHASRELRVVGQCHASFTRRDDLDWMKTEDRDVAVGAAAYFAPLITSAYSVRAVFYDLDPIAPRKSLYCRHIAGLPGEVHGHQHFRQATRAFRLC